MGTDFFLSDELRARLLKAGIPADRHNLPDLRAWLLEYYGTTASPKLTLEELADVVVYMSEHRVRDH
jgi:hypothetical protein